MTNTPKKKYAHFDQAGQMIAITRSATVSYPEVKHSQEIPPELLDAQHNLKSPALKLNTETGTMQGFTPEPVEESQPSAT